MKTKNVVAGVIDVSCTCCTEARELIHHVQLGPTRMLCPTTGKTYLDRGDGLFQPDGQTMSPPVERSGSAGPFSTTEGRRGVEIEARGEVTTPASDLLSDRPARTSDKQRITLERATFA